jgi:hypothetical protein
MVERARLASSSELVRSGSEPDIAADLGVDDGIARDDLAFAGRALPTTQ